MNPKTIVEYRIVTIQYPLAGVLTRNAEES